MGICSRILFVAFTAAFLMLLGACSGQSGSTSSELQLINLPIHESDLPTLDSLDSMRQSSVATQVAIDPQQTSTTGGQVSNQGQDLLLNSAPGTASWAMYGYQAGTDPLISLRLTFTYPNGPGAWVALANYQTGRWDWQPKAQLTQVTYQLSTNANRNYVSPKGNMFFVVMSADDRDVVITDLLMVADLPQQTFDISGKVTDPNFGPLQGILIGLTPGTDQATTDASGNYSFTGVLPGAYTLTPLVSEMNYTPPTINLNVVDSNLVGQDFIAEPIPQVPTYVADIASLIDGAGGTEKSCLDCHSGKFPDGDLDLSTYTAVKDNASKINDAVNASSDWMPKDNDKWSQEHLDLFQLWIDTGKTEQ
ncbi:MAG: carboxypeptidase regulatory-like domain-containing protein [Planctomycetales bacterium]|nr:carboxypeptidase regulatory-like domain-containing protein [bacterium]UNM07283.1 MAG: carboxypeptidase regulatory-like domain-containing protein [Planctomycetales bacterium]